MVPLGVMTHTRRARPILCRETGRECFRVDCTVMRCAEEALARLDERLKARLGPQPDPAPLPRSPRRNYGRTGLPRFRRSYP